MNSSTVYGDTTLTVEKDSVKSWLLPSRKSKCQDLPKSEFGGGGCVLAKSKVKLP